ncbi:hypothetical protein [uncultured Marinobacter sp.]|uniref:hypothetical protein n=1 Tax=uncultured Marinobacter sp. TaxID=187379 RepID=UPI0030D9124B
MRRIWMVALLAGILAGCANVSRFEKDALVAHGEHLNNAPETLYYTLFIEIGRVTDANIMKVLVKLTPDAPPILLSEVKPESVARYLPRFVPPPQWPEHLKKKATEYQAYVGGGFHITFDDGRFISIGICSHCSGGREYPVIGTPNGNDFYTLPLTEQQLIDVFGSPGRVYKVNEVRY